MSTNTYLMLFFLSIRALRERNEANGETQMIPMHPKRTIHGYPRRNTGFKRGNHINHIDKMS